MVERRVELKELDRFTECGLCGTAAVISPVGKIQGHFQSSRRAEKNGVLHRPVGDTALPWQNRVVCQEKIGRAHV